MYVWSFSPLPSPLRSSGPAPSQTGLPSATGIRWRFSESDSSPTQHNNNIVVYNDVYCAITPCIPFLQSSLHGCMLPYVKCVSLFLSIFLLPFALCVSTLSWLLYMNNICFFRVDHDCG